LHPCSPRRWSKVFSYRNKAEHAQAAQRDEWSEHTAKSRHPLPAKGRAPFAASHPSPDGSERAARLRQAPLRRGRAAEDALRLLHVALRLREAGAEAGPPAPQGQARRGVAEAGVAQAQALDVPVVGTEAGVARLAAGVGAAVAALALVAAGARDARAAEALARGLVAPRILRALEVAVALWGMERWRDIEVKPTKRGGKMKFLYIYICIYMCIYKKIRPC